MKNLLLISAIILSGVDAYGATARSAVSGTSASRSTSGRNIVTTVPQTQTVTGQQTRTVVTRGGVQTANSVSTPQSGQVNRGRSATTPVSTARAAKQSVVTNSTKIAAAAQNTAVDQACWEKFSGCMDSFCMLDNANGGRCICSDKNADYDAILAEIQSLDEQSYQLATVGVERIEMGDAADAVMSKTNTVTKSVEKEYARDKSKRPTLDLSAWDVNEMDFDSAVDVEDMFSMSSDGISIEGKTGDSLYRVSAKLCNAQLPDCSSQAKMMELMYKQRIRSDCTAYENSLRQQRTQSAQKLAAAQRAMRDAALDQYRDANKYDLGQCTVQFKQCMQTTGGCGDDFTGCVEWSVRDGLVKGNSTKMQTIKGTSSKIELSAATYDVLLGKKELCMGVTQQCVNVRDKVWDTFLREVAPQVKSAELIVESNMRTSCISNIASCFQKACRDNMDPNDPEGSYDMCLTRPETLRSACKVEIDPCEGGIPNIMDYVRARLASMRVDSCTREFKECLTSEDRCGKDYTQCVGLDTDTIVRMCPAEKLVGCQYDGGNSKDQNGYQKATVRTDDEIYKELATIAQGIFLNIDNNMLTACQRAADAAMIRVCGSTENCDNIVVDEGLGARSLEYKICPYTKDENEIKIDFDDCIPSIDMISDKDLGRNAIAVGQSETTNTGNAKHWVAVIDGKIYWESVVVNDIVSNVSDYDAYGKLISAVDYFEKLGLDSDEGLTQTQKERITQELSSLQTSINNAISAIEADTTVKNCKSGRDGTWRYGEDTTDSEGRFPHLTDQMRHIITTSALSKTKANYYAKYDEMNEKMLKDYAKIAERVAEINGQNAKDLNRDVARQSCLNLSDVSSLARSAEPPKSAGTYFLAAAAVGGAIATGGTAAMIAGPVLAGVILGDSYWYGGANGSQKDFVIPGERDLVASKEVNNWNYKETITTTFNWDSMVCHKCVRSQQCSETKNPLAGNKYCATWAEPTEECTDTQF